MLRRSAMAWMLRAISLWDRLRLRVISASRPGLRIHPTASTNFAHARYRLGEGARLIIGPGVVCDRIHHGVCFDLEPGARVEILDGAWLRAQVGTVYIQAFAGAEMQIGPEALLNGCHLSAKGRLVLGRRAWVGPGSRVFDSDQHDFDADHPERIEPVEIGDYAWIASDVLIARGVTIGAHSVVGAHSLVTRDIPPHTVAYGTPALPKGRVGDRSRVS